MSDDTTIAKQRKIQAEQDERDKQKPAEARQSRQQQEAGGGDKRQHLEKPGHEADLQRQPKFLASSYIGSKKLEGKVAIVTGGDSGIGRAVAILFAREGAKLVLAYLCEHEDAQETQRYVEAEGGECVLMAGDVKEPGFCRKVVEKAIETYGRLDILVNNAAFQEHADSLLDITEERFDETLKTNIYGYFHMARAALPHLKEGASIINTGSVTGLRGNAKLLDYSTTKGAIHAFTMSLAANLLDQGIRVNGVAPGPVWTPLNPADKPIGEIGKFGSQTSFHRPAEPEEISPAYVFLAAPSCSSYITGVIVPITGSVGE